MKGLKHPFWIIFFSFLKIKFCTKTCLKCDTTKVNKKEKTKIINEMSPQNPLQVVIQPLVESQEKDRKRIERECEDKNEK